MLTSDLPPWTCIFTAIQEGEGYLRASVGMAAPRVREAMERLKKQVLASPR